MIVSFLVICILGCAFIFTCWMRFNPTVGVIRCVGFVVIMGGVHFVGYRAWKRQRVAAAEQVGGHSYADIWDAYGDAIKSAVAQQAVMLLFSALLLDGGLALRICTFGAVGAWAFNIVILARRPRSPTPTDVSIVKYSFWLAVLVAWVLAGIMGRIF
jgi:hypothetical protein